MKPSVRFAVGFRGAKVLQNALFLAHLVVKNVKTATAHVMFPSNFAYIEVEIYFT